MQGRLPSPELQVEVVIPDHDAPIARQRQRKEQLSALQRQQRRRQQLRFPGRALARAMYGSRPADAGGAAADAERTVADPSRGERFDDIVDVVSEVANAFRDLRGSGPTTSTFTQHLKTGG